VNTPLAVISSYTQMLTKQIRNDEVLSNRLSPVLEKITQQTFRASEIVNGLLNFSRTSAVEFTQVDLNQLLRDSATLLQHQLKSARVRVDSELADDLAVVRGNQGKLQQVILNLMLNAKDAMQGSSGGVLRVRTCNAENRVVVELHDSGVGIAPEHVNRIFDPFFTTKTNPQAGEHKGTGLGLAVSYGILQEHGGTINVESVLGEGTTFRLELPAAPVALPVGIP
jgi:two-component system NtrC family sensor kinase